MRLTTEQVKKISKLARIQMSEEQLQKYRRELENIFNWVEKLQEVNTDGIEPLTTVHASSQPMRADQSTVQNNSSELMALAPASKYDYFIVPKVVE